MAGVAIGISLEIILMLGFGLPEVACRNDFGRDNEQDKSKPKMHEQPLR
jgi:hypothetical protein